MLSCGKSVACLVGRTCLSHVNQTSMSRVIRPRGLHHPTSDGPTGHTVDHVIWPLVSTNLNNLARKWAWSFSECGKCWPGCGKYRLGLATWATDVERQWRRSTWANFGCRIGNYASRIHRSDKLGRWLRSTGRVSNVHRANFCWVVDKFVIRPAWYILMVVVLCKMVEFVVVE